VDEYLTTSDYTKQVNKCQFTGKARDLSVPARVNPFAELSMNSNFPALFCIFPVMVIPECTE
jgi:hypothetical protein